MRLSLADRIRDDFPILSTMMNGHPLVYLDNGATTQKPTAVIDAIVHYYTHDNANIHRGVYELSQRATDAYEGARRKVADFLGADDPAECIFVRGATEGINLVAASWGAANLHPGDEVLLTALEHHSNIVPWQMICQRTGAQLRVMHATESGEIDMDPLDELLNANTKLVAIQQVSNALGTIHDMAAIIRRARKVGARVLVDGAQWVGHYRTNVKQLDCDFYVFSGHKLYGPTGIGVLWGRRSLLQEMPPYQGGGDMIETVAFNQTTYAALPNRLEAGTPDIAGAIGLGAAIDYVQTIGFDAISAYEHELLEYATEKLNSIEGLKIIGTSHNKASVISFIVEAPSIAPLDIATSLASEGIAIRTGHHCCMPLMEEMHVSGTCRASMAMYNTRNDIDRLAAVLSELISTRRMRSTSHSQTPAAAGDSSPEAITFAPQYASSTPLAAESLAEEFLMFDDLESKTELLMEMGQQLPNSFDALKKISTAVPGCMSEVYLIGRPKSDAPESFEFVADSNAEIVRGLIAMLEALFSGQPATEILAFDIESFFRRIGLNQFVSSQRRSGLDGMIRRIRTLAQAIVEREHV
jgi:cysteine desulfurase/selenocysteine lyase